MSYHVWGDEWFQKYGNDLNQAMEFISVECKRRAGMVIMIKEKYGSIRFEYLYFYPNEWPIYGYFYPGRIYYRWPRWMRRVERLAIKVMDKTGLTKRLHYQQTKTLKAVVFEAIDKWPHLKDEILSDLSCHENIVGKKIHDQYWRSYDKDGR